MPKLQIEGPSFLEALESGGCEITYYLDLQTGVSSQSLAIWTMMKTSSGP